MRWAGRQTLYSAWLWPWREAAVVLLLRAPGRQAYVCLTPGAHTSPNPYPLLPRLTSPPSLHPHPNTHLSHPHPLCRLWHALCHCRAGPLLAARQRQGSSSAHA